MAFDYDLPTFADIDFNFDGTIGDAFVCNAHTIPGPMEYARSAFAFPGVSGVMVNNLGKRRRPITWLLTVIAKKPDDLATFIATLESYQNNGGYTMTCKNRTFTNVVLVSVTPVGPGPEGNWELVYEPAIYNAAPMLMQLLRLDFEELTPL